MAQRGAAELLAGAAVLAAAIGFLGYAVANTGHVGGSGYTLHATFDHVDGLGAGSDVRMAGVKIGSVSSERLDPKSFQAIVTFTVGDAVKLPKDSSVAITSDGLLGGKYMAIEAGGDPETIPAGGAVTITQSSISIEQLLGKFIFSVGNLGGKPGDTTKPADGAAPAPIK